MVGDSIAPWEVISSTDTDQARHGYNSKRRQDVQGRAAEHIE
jgi:hypothetical protein